MQGRFHEALLIYVGMYAKLMDMQKLGQERAQRNSARPDK